MKITVLQDGGYMGGSGFRVPCHVSTGVDLNTPQSFMTLSPYKNLYKVEKNIYKTVKNILYRAPEPTCNSVLNQGPLKSGSFGFRVKGPETLNPGFTKSGPCRLVLHSCLSSAFALGATLARCRLYMAYCQF